MSKEISKSWCYTLNNYTNEDIAQFKAFTVSKHRCCLEIGESGTAHMQGAITFLRAYRLTQLKKLNSKVHWEKSLSCDPENYCTKGEIIIDINNKKQGNRVDIQTAIELSKTKMTLSEFLDQATSYQSIKVFELAKAVKQKQRNFQPDVIWIYGPTGTGKTRAVIWKEKDLWISGKNLEWWPGYENQEATLFDDFRKDFCTYHELLRILDRTPYTVAIKGGHRILNSKRMYITSCYAPEDMYETREDIQQLLRRITKVIRVTDTFEFIKNENVTVTEVQEGNTNFLDFCNFE